MVSVKSKLDFLNRILGKSSRSSDGVNYAFHCPKCASSDRGKKKLVIKIDDDSYHCWVCDLKGRGLGRLFRRYFPSASDEYRRSFANFDKFKYETADSEPANTEIDIPEFKLLALQNNACDPDTKATLKYIFGRGLTDRDLWYFKLGTTNQGRFRRRVIIPSFDANGHMNYYVARTIDKATNRKYVNAKIPKKDIIFNEININWSREITLVEGPFDLMKCDENSTCILGSNLGEKSALFQSIVKHQTPVILALDSDVSSKAHAIAKRLAEFGVKIRMLDTGKFEDVGAMSRRDFLIAKKNAVPWNDTSRLYHMIGNIKTGSILG